MTKITITEALAEIKTAEKKIKKKREFILQFLSRQEGLKDPLEKDGGSVEMIQRERQAISDIEKRVVELRQGIAKANEKTTISFGDDTRPISEWLTWRREIAPGQNDFLRALNFRLNSVRDNAKRMGNAIVAGGAQPEKPTDVIVNINETELAREAEKLEEILSNIDGQLSLKNATVTI
jgi:hypothetical protein